ncbi:MAG: hypothetical protein M3162_03865 [Thermoproteota archaeon]|nr:hypothetical protein [Thermoproteota archaeon]
MVKAKPRKKLLENLREQLDTGKILKIKPFGPALQYSLENARIDTENPDYALWVEEDYCSPPLAMEKEIVLNQYFKDIYITPVESEDEGWSRLKDKPRFWNNQ